MSDANKPQKAVGAAKRPNKVLAPAPEAAQKAKEAATKAYINAIGIQDIETAIAENRQRQQIEALKPKKIGRPTKRTPEVVKEICDRLSNGEPLRAICRDSHIPNWDTVYDWMARDEGFALLVAQARENGVEAIAQDTLAMIDAPPQVVVDNNGVSRIDPAYVQWTKLRTEQRMKLLACWSPNRYGNRVQVAGDKDNPLQVNIQATEMFESILKNAEMTRQIEE